MYIQDLRACDMLIIIGTSLKVYLLSHHTGLLKEKYFDLNRYPFASLVNMVEDHVPRLLFNLEEAGPFEGVMVNTFPLRFKLAEHPFVCSYAAGPPLHHLTLISFFRKRLGTTEM